MPHQALVAIEIYNVLGQKIKTLVNAELFSGVHQIEWDGSDDRGLKVSAGTYLIMMRSEDFIQTRKMMMLN